MYSTIASCSLYLCQLVEMDGSSIVFVVCPRLLCLRLSITELIISIFFLSSQSIHLASCVLKLHKHLGLLYNPHAFLYHYEVTLFTADNMEAVKPYLFVPIQRFLLLSIILLLIHVFVIFSSDLVCLPM